MNGPFEGIKFKQYEKRDLVGKQLLMLYGEDSGVGILAGKDTETGDIYVLSETFAEGETSDE